MLKIVIAIALAAIALAVFFLGRDALLVVVGVGVGVGFAELIDLGVRMSVGRAASPDEEEEVRPRR